MNTSKVVERPRGTVDVPHCSWRPESERMKGDPNVTNLDVTPDAQETARQGTQAQELAGKARNVQRAACCIVGGGPAGGDAGAAARPPARRRRGAGEARRVPAGPP